MNDPTARIRIYTLRPFAVVIDGRPLRSEGRAQRKPLRLLKLLAALGGENVAEQALTDALWPDADGDAAHHAFATTLYRLRQLIGTEVLRFSDGRLSVDRSSCALDLWDFQAAATEAEQAGSRGDEEKLLAATGRLLECYRAPFLAGEFDPPEILAARQRLHAQLLRVVSEAAERFHARGALDAQQALLQRSLEIDDESEELYRRLMRCHLEQRRIADGLALYERCRSVLSAKAGVDPSPETEAVQAQLIHAQADQKKHPESPVAPSTQVQRAPEPGLDDSTARSESRTAKGRALRVAIALGFIAIVASIIGGYWLRQAFQAPEAAVATRDVNESERPSIAVLPFANLSGDPSLDYFTDGLAEDLITDLAQYRELSVAARNSSFKYKHEAVDVREVGRDLGVRYVLEGSARASQEAETLRIAVQLIDARSGNHLWAERWDLPLRDFLAVQDQIVDKVVVAIDVNLIAGRQTISLRGSTRSYEAYRLSRRAWEFFSNISQTRAAETIRLFEQALAIDPAFTMALNGIGWVHYQEYFSGWRKDSDQTLAEAEQSARKALSLDPIHPGSLSLLAMVLSHQRRWDEAVNSAELAVQIDRSDAVAAGILAAVFNFNSEFERATAEAKRAFDLAPAPHAWMYNVLGVSKMGRNLSREAVPDFEKTIVMGGNWPSPYVHLIAAYVESGNLESAKQTGRKLLEVDPGFSAEALYPEFSGFRDRALVERLRIAARKAGLK